MPEGHDATIEVCNIMSFVLYTQILKQSVLKPASPGITLIGTCQKLSKCKPSNIQIGDVLLETVKSACSH